MMESPFNNFYKFKDITNELVKNNNYKEAELLFDKNIVKG